MRNHPWIKALLFLALLFAAGRGEAKGNTQKSAMPPSGAVLEKIQARISDFPQLLSGGKLLPEREVSFPPAAERAALSSALICVHACARPGSASGSGFFISKDRLVTNFHVIDRLNSRAPLQIKPRFIRRGGAKAPSVRFQRIIHLSAIHDIAVMEVSGYEGPFLPLGAFSQESQELYIAGFPNRQFQNIIARKISSSRLEFSANFNSLDGTSGSALLNSRGEAVAIVHAGMGNILEAVPIKALKSLLERKALEGHPEDLIQNAIAELAHKARSGDAKAQYELGFRLQNRNDEGESLFWFEKAAEQGHADAQYMAASIIYKEMEGVSEKGYAYLQAAENQGHMAALYKRALIDSLGAVKHEESPQSEYNKFRALADNGHADAQYVSGLFLLNGFIPAKQSEQEALRRLLQAAEQGHAEAQHSLAALLFDKGGDLQDAFEWAERAAEQGHEPALALLGKWRLRGAQTKQDLNRACSYWEKAADQDIEALEELQSEAALSLSASHFNCLDYLFGKYHFEVLFPQDLISKKRKKMNRKAFAFLTSAADSGLAAAAHFLGRMYLTGLYVEQNSAMGWLYIQKAAEQGHARSKTLLGIELLYGGDYFPMEKAQALITLQEAAEEGDPIAQYELGLAHYLGNGAAQNYEQAHLYWEKAAEQGHAEARANIGIMFQHGEGVEKDDNEAFYHMFLAADLGSSDAQISLSAECAMQEHRNCQNDADFWLQEALKSAFAQPGGIIMDKLMKQHGIKMRAKPLQ